MHVYNCIHGFLFELENFGDRRQGFAEANKKHVVLTLLYVLINYMGRGLITHFITFLCRNIFLFSKLY